MFIKTQGFKKLINDAYKSTGLTVGCDGCGMYLSGGWWEIHIKEGCIPKEELGELIKLTGELPGPGEVFKARKEGNQYEIEGTHDYNFDEKAEQCKEYMEVTPLTLRYATGQQARILQSPNNSMIILINDRIIDMIDNTVIQYEKGETQAEGPLIGAYPGVFYRNNQMALLIMPRTDDENKKLIAYLENFTIMAQEMDDEH